ncbi:amidase [Hyphococcus sp.]|jgi:amidase|uniref:amidase n=1 Tax=Hyphococcus sp. TaxID=2038636 RepID=UPI003D09C277
MSFTRRHLMRSGGLGAMLLTAAGACSRPDQAGSTELAELDAVETAARIKSGDLSGEEAVSAAIERAKRIDKEVNAIATKTFKSAQEDAANPAGVMGGVPTFIKDLYDVTGVPSGFGSRAFPGYKGGEQLPYVTEFLNTGVVSLGKSTTPEFGLTATTESVATGKTRNPWNLDHSSGGSSGGAAALVASGVVPIAHATDGGGSIRIPASCCGTVGLKVSRGRTPMGEPADLPITLSTHGVESRTMRDTAAISAAMALPASESGLAPLGLVTGPVKERLRIALVMDGPGGAYAADPAVREATQSVAALCEELGHQVEEAQFPVDEQFSADFRIFWAAMAHRVVKLWEETFHLPRNGIAFEPFTLGLAKMFEEKQATYEETVDRLRQVEGAMADFHQTYDVILSPVLRTPPPEIGYLGAKLDYETLMERLTDYVQYTPLYNVSGAPAISLPLSMSLDGLPIGAMFGAGVGREDLLIGLGFEMEEARPWAGRRPAVFG